MAIDWSRLGLPKPEPRRRTKRRRERQERAVKQDVRAQCVERDGSCRLAGAVFCVERQARLYERTYTPVERHRCSGPSEWAHLGENRRAKTVGQDPAVRHTVHGSLMLCRGAHAAYDGRARPRIEIEEQSRSGADGALRFTWKGLVYVEDQTEG